MVTFISIEHSKPKILTWNLYHHLPSYLAVLLCLREKLARRVPLLDFPVNFAEQYSSLIVCQFGITMTFLRSKYVQANLFLIQQICFSFMIASLCQKPITYSVRWLYFHFIKRQQSYLQSCCCRAIGETNSIIVSYQFPIRFVSKGSFDKLKLYFLDGFLQLVVLIP